MKNVDDNDDNSIIDTIGKDIKKGTELGIARIINAIFDNLLQPIINLINSIASVLKKKFNERTEQKNISKITYSNLLHDYLDENNCDCIIFKLTEKVDYAKTFFTNISEHNKYTQKLSYYKSPFTLVRKWVEWCGNSIDLAKKDYKFQTRMYFNKYKKIQFRQHKNCFILILCNGTKGLSTEQQTAIYKLIDKFL